MDHRAAPAEERTPPPPARLWTLRFAVLWLVGLGTYASAYLLISVLPLYLQRLGLAAAAIGMVLALKNATAFLSRPFIGWLSEGWGRRVLIAAGIVALGLSNVGLAFATGALAFALLRGLNGLGWGAATVSANTVAGELAPPGRRGEAIGAYSMAASAALALGPGAGLFLVPLIGYRGTFAVASACAALGLLATPLLPGGGRAELPPFSLDGLVSRAALVPALALLGQQMAYGAMLVFLPLLAAERHLGNTGIFFLIYAVFLFALRSLAGRLSDRFGRPQVIAPGLVLAGGAMLLLWSAQSALVMDLAAALFAVGMALVQPVSLAWGLDLSGGRRGTAMATMVMAQDLGITIGGAVLGAVAGVAGVGGVFLAGAAANVFGLAILGLDVGCIRRSG